MWLWLGFLINTRPSSSRKIHSIIPFSILFYLGLEFRLRERKSELKWRFARIPSRVCMTVQVLSLAEHLFPLLFSFLIFMFCILIIFVVLILDLCKHFLVSWSCVDITWCFWNCWIVLLNSRCLLSYEKLNHFLACSGYLDEGLKGEISNTGTLGFNLIAWCLKENYGLRNHWFDNRVPNEPKLIEKSMKIDY